MLANGCAVLALALVCLCEKERCGPLPVSNFASRHSKGKVSNREVKKVLQESARQNRARLTERMALMKLCKLCCFSYGVTV